MLEKMFLPYKRYADFKGRSTRSEYWWFMLFFVGVIAIGYAMMGASGAFDPAFDPDTDAGALFYIATLGIFVFVLASLVPAIAVEVRRYHDQDRSGWFWFVRFVPIVGGFIVLVFMCLPGTKGDNRYGPDPQDQYGTGVFS